MSGRGQHWALSEEAWLVLCALACVLASLLLVGPALGPTTYILYGKDTVAHDYIMLLYGWGEIFRQHSIPLWCPYLFGGFPFVGSFAFCPFYPSQWLFAIAPFNTAFTLQYLLAIALGGVTSALWARRLGCTRGVALWAGLLFCVSGHFLTLVHAGHLQKVIAIAWAPLALALAPKLSERGTCAVRAMVVVAVALAMQLLASHMQIAYATALAVLGFAASSLRAERWSDVLVLVRNFAAATALAALFSAAQLFPGIETAAISNRADGVSFKEAVETSYPPRELWEFVIPRVFGDSVSGSPVPYFGTWGERIVSDFLGVAAVLLAAIALFAGVGPWRWTLALTTTASLLIGLGDHTPIYRILYENLPGFSRFRSPGTFMFLATVSLVQLAALGLEVLRRAYLVDLLRVPRTRVLVIAGCAALLGLLMTANPHAIGPWLGIGTAEQWAKFGFALAQKIRLAGVQFVAFASLIAVIVVAAPGSRIAPRRDASGGRNSFIKLAFIALVLATPVVPAVTNHYFIRFAPLDDYFSYLLSRRYCVRAPGNKPEPTRIMGPNLLDNRPLVWGTGSPAGYHPVFLKRYADLVQALGWYHPQLLRQYAVHEVNADSSLRLPVAEWEVITCEDKLRQCWHQRLPEYLRISRRVVVRSTTEEVLKTLAANSVSTPPKRPFVALKWESELEASDPTIAPLDEHEWAVADAATLWRVGLSVFWTDNSDDWVIWRPHLYARMIGDKVLRQAMLPRKIPRFRPYVMFSKYRPGAMELKLSYQDTGIVLVAENYSPGWKAETEDRKQVMLLPVNHSQLGVLFRSKHWDFPQWTVKLSYAPFSWRLGLFLSLIGWSTLITYLLSRMVQKRCFPLANTGQRPPSDFRITPCPWTIKNES